MKKIFRIISDLVQSKNDVPNLTVKDFFDSFDKSENNVLLDVRKTNECLEGKIEGSINIDYLGDSFASKIQTLPKDKHYYIYCRSGIRSMNACAAMQKMGFTNVYNLDGGFLAYSKIKQ